MPLSAGTRLGPYEVVAPLGAGGMCEVYRARDTRLDRHVALKILPAHLAHDGDALSRFQREARVVAALSHPNILALHDVGQQDSVAYAVTELLEGETLRERLRQGALPLRKAMEYAAQMAEGLAAAHEKGIVHRDLKPENLFVTSEGRVKILDFGLARQVVAPAVNGDSNATRDTDPGAIVGTVGYMAPEQVSGEAVEHRADVFSFGCVLYEMLAGRRAFDRPTSPETMTAILREDPPPLSDVLPPLPPSLERIVWRCLEKKPSERFQSGRDLAFTLAALSGASGPGGLVAVGPRLGGRRLTRTAPALAAVLAVSAGSYIAGRRSAAPSSPASRALPRASFTGITGLAGIEESPSLSPDGKTLAFVSRAAGNADIYVQRVGGHNPINLTRDCAADDRAPAFSPDGEQIAFRSECEGSGVFIMGATGESRRRVTDLGHDPAWSPDGKRLAVASEPTIDPLSRQTNSRVWIVDVATGAKRSLSERDAMQPFWSPSGRRVAYWGLSGPGTGQRDLWTMAAGGGDPVEVTNDPPPDWNPVWSSDGRFLYFCSGRGGTMNLWRVAIDEASGRVLAEPEPLTTPASWVTGLSVSRDGKRVAYSTREARSTVHLVSVDPLTGRRTGSPKLVLGGSRVLWWQALSPDGQWLAFTTRGVREDLFVVRVDGTAYRQLTDDAFPDRGPDWSPDGGRIAFYSNRSGVFEIWLIRPDGGGLERIPGEGLLVPRWSPEGTRMTATSTGRATGSVSEAYVFHLPRPSGGRRPEPLPLITPHLSFFPSDWSPDGTRLAGPGLRPDGTRQGVYVHSLADGAYRRIAEEGMQARWLADGRHVLYSRRGGLRIVDVTSLAVRELLPEGSLDDGTGAFSLSRDGRTLTYAKTTVEGDVWLAALE